MQSRSSNPLLKSASASQATGLAGRWAVLLALVVSAFALPRQAMALGPICRVDPAAAGSGTGGSWANAMTSLQTALGTAACTEIWVKAGVYKPGGGSSDRFAVRSGVKVYGGFAGTETLRNQRNWESSVTVLSGDIDNNDAINGSGYDDDTTKISGTNSLNVVWLDGTTTDVTATTVLDGFVITAGDGTAGAGLYCDGQAAGSVCSPTLAHLVFSGNRASNGGAMLLNGSGGGTSKATLLHVRFQANAASSLGGALYIDGNQGSASPVMSDVEFFDNNAVGGAAMYVDGRNGGVSKPSITRGTFSANNATGAGGGMWNAGTGGNASPVLKNVSFSSNTAGVGGAIANYGDGGGNSSPTIIDAFFENNTATGPAGAIENYGSGGNSSPTITNATFDSNAALAGGAIQNWGDSSGVSNPKITNVTFVANSASADGGAIFNEGNAGQSNPVFKNVTMTANSANNGGAIWSDAFSGQSNPVLENSILYGNTATASGNEIYNNAGATPVIDHSLVQGSGGSGGAWSGGLGTDGGGNIDADPLLMPMDDYGGAVETLPLGAGSPAIDAGTNTGCPAKDARGKARPQDGDGNGSKVCDMGATEGHRFKTTVKSKGSADGWVLESDENSGTGGSINAGASTFRLGDDAANRQYRAILSFDTHLQNGSTVSSGKLMIRKAGVAGSNPFSILGGLTVDLGPDTFSDVTALETSDFDWGADQPDATSFGSTPASGWYTATFGPSSYADLAFTNTALQVRLRFTTDDNNDLGADYMKFYSGNASTASYRPKLMLQGYAP